MLALKEENSLVIKDDDIEFKKPLHPAPRKKVLDEETYIKVRI